PRGRRVTRGRGRDGDQRLRVSLRPHARGRRLRGSRRRDVQPLDHAAVGRRDHPGGGLDRDRPRHLRVLAAGALPRRRLLLRRPLVPPVRAPASRPPDPVSSAAAGAPVRGDDRGARAGLVEGGASPLRRACRAGAAVRAGGTLGTVQAAYACRVVRRGRFPVAVPRLFVVLAAALAMAVTFAGPAAAVDPQARTPALQFLGQAIIPTGATFAGTEVDRKSVV